MMSVTTLPFGRPLTAMDLQAMPDDGHRYELIDGSLVVSPAPRRMHQRALLRLHALLDELCPPELEMLVAPFAVLLAEDTEVQPDLIVAPPSQFTETHLPGPPLLVVEVLSPSTRRVDLLLKRDRYQAAGIASYWLIDVEEPSITVLELVDGRYVEVARGAGDVAVQVSRPFPAQITASALVR